MFILRRISGRGIQMNHVLGEQYTIIGKFENPEEFKRTFLQHFKKDHVADSDETSDFDTKNVTFFIANEDGSILQPIYKNQQNYIMTDSGRTFDNLNKYM